VPAEPPVKRDVRSKGKDMIRRVIIVIAVLAGGIIGRSLIGHPAGAYIGVAVGWAIGHLLTYLRVSPKTLLSFHRKDDFSRYFTLAELHSLLARVTKGGLLRTFDYGDFSCSVDRATWEKLTHEERETLCRLGFEYCRQMLGKDFVDESLPTMYFYVTAYSLESTSEPLGHYIPGRGLLRECNHVSKEMGEASEPL
jgi:hypothetical protein